MKKRLAAMILAVMMAAMVGAAFAGSDMTGEGGVIGEFATPDTPTAQDKAVKLYKEITAFNPESCTVNAPTITYTYTITPVSAGKDIYDVKTAHDPNASVHAQTKAGITTGITINSGTAGTTASAIGSVAWTPSDQLSASAAGTKNVKSFEINFSNVVYTGAGIYRYKIVETVNSYGSSGVVDSGSSNHTRYLDVYVKDGTGTGAAAYDIYGYVCFTNNNSIDARDGATTNTVAAAGKTEGFIGVDTNGDGDYTDSGETPADNYYTYNLTISKTLSGDQAMNGHDFPFKVEFTNGTVTGNVLPVVDGTGVLPTLSAGPISGFTIDGTSSTAAQRLKLANGENVIFKGIPAGTKAVIDEYNDVTGTIYRVTTAGATENEGGGINLGAATWASAVTGWGGTVSGTAENAVYALGGTADTNAAATANFTVAFTNTLETISPTGIMLRVAPYLAMLAAGIALFVILFVKRRKPGKDE